MIFFCPVALSDHAGEVDERAHGSYGMSGPASEVVASSVDNPAHRFVVTEGSWVGSSPWWYGATHYIAKYAPDPVHDEAANFAFMDGHVGTLAEDEYLKNRSRWDPKVSPR